MGATRWEKKRAAAAAQGTSSIEPYPGVLFLRPRFIDAGECLGRRERRDAPKNLNWYQVHSHVRDYPVPSVTVGMERPPVSSTGTNHEALTAETSEHATE
jgi:hypothetical protein